VSKAAKQSDQGLATHAAVWQAKHLEPAGGQVCGSLRILLGLDPVVVHRSIDFQDQPMSRAIEIDNESINHLLPSKLHSQNAAPA